MATLTCTNKGCYKTTSDSLLDADSNEIICSECGREIKGISPFTKRSMIGLKKASKSATKSYSVKCNKCLRSGQPEYKNGIFVCFNCGEELQLTQYFKKLFIEYKATNKSGD